MGAVDADLKSSRRALITKNPIDNTSWNLNEAVRNARLLRDEDNNVVIMPTFSINPTTNPITAAGSLGAVQVSDGTTPAQELAVDASGNLHAGIWNANQQVAVVISTAGDASAQTNSLNSNSLTRLYNGATWDKGRNNVNLYKPAADTATTTFTGADVPTYNARGLLFTINITSITGTSITPEIDIKDANGNYWTLFTGAAQTATGAIAYYLSSSGTGTKLTLGASGSATSYSTLGANVGALGWPAVVRVVVAKTAITVLNALYTIDMVC